MARAGRLWMFGGSGLLAHTAKRAKPKARVIYNDYDNYSERLANIDSTNALRREIHRLLAPMPKDGSLSAEIAGQIRTAILAHQAAGGYIDIGCLNAWLCFGGDWFQLAAARRRLAAASFGIASCCRFNSQPREGGW